jgi:addiction module HigA family antidote
MMLSRHSAATVVTASLTAGEALGMSQMTFGPSPPDAAVASCRPCRRRALELSVTDAAERLSMSRVALSRVINGKAGISSDLALRLEEAGVSTARVWVNLQANYDLWRVM